MHEIALQKGRIAVVGAAGFVGRELLKALADQGIRATAVVRGNPDLVVDGDAHDVLKQEAISAATTHEVVINLAYPTGGSPYAYPEFNRQIFRTVEGLLAPGGHLIHVSTQAVFGLALDRPVTLGRVEQVRDDGYVENKIEAELYFQKLASQRGLKLDIVRLGNVWGRASGAWALPLVQRLMTGRAVGVTGVHGFSNTTDVANVAAYLSYLAARGGPQETIKFHHLAEFAHVPWQDWFGPIAKELGVTPVFADASQVQLRSAAIPELRAAAEGLSPRRVYQRLATERVVGSYIRSLLRLIPDNRLASLKDKKIFYKLEALGPSEQGFLNVVSARQVFTGNTEVGWTPPVDKATSLARVLGWIRGED